MKVRDKKVVIIHGISPKLNINHIFNLFCWFGIVESVLLNTKNHYALI